MTVNRPNNLAEAILSGERADDPAVFYGQACVTHGELRAAVRGWHALLRRGDCVPGERIGLLAENGPFFVAAYLGIIRAGLCAVPFPADCPRATFERIVAASGIRRLLVSARFRPRMEPWAQRLGAETLVEPVVPPTSDVDPPPAEVNPRADLAAIVWTSGSTGEVKGVMVTHHNILVNTEDIIDYVGLGASDRAMCVLPFHYCFGASLLHTHLMAGGSVVINNRFMFPEKVLDEMQRRACTGLAGVPATYQILLRKSSFAERRFPALRWLQQAGGKLPDPYIREIRRALPEVKFFIMYGQTEATARLSYLPPERLADKFGSIGRGLPHTRLEVLRPDGTPVVPGLDEVGEIVASGENVTPGYWNDPRETARFFRHGRLHTGDMARVDSDGFIYVVERERDFIKAMGFRVGPKEVEDVLAEMPEIVESAVVGVPDELWGEAIKAYVVTVRPGQLSAAEVRDFCTARLPNYKVPRQVEFLPALPKTTSGKVDKPALRERSRADIREK